MALMPTHTLGWSSSSSRILNVSSIAKEQNGLSTDYRTDPFLPDGDYDVQATMWKTSDGFQNANIKTKANPNIQTSQATLSVSASIRA
jgi:hypothetical protein